jgi:hypothetical protein
VSFLVRNVSKFKHFITNWSAIKVDILTKESILLHCLDALLQVVYALDESMSIRVW